MRIPALLAALLLLAAAHDLIEDPYNAPVLLLYPAHGDVAYLRAGAAGLASFALVRAEADVLPSLSLCVTSEAPLTLAADGVWAAAVAEGLPHSNARACASMASLHTRLPLLPPGLHTMSVLDTTRNGTVLASATLHVRPQPVLSLLSASETEEELVLTAGLRWNSSDVSGLLFNVYANGALMLSTPATADMWSPANGTVVPPPVLVYKATAAGENKLQFVVVDASTGIPLSANVTVVTSCDPPNCVAVLMEEVPASPAPSPPPDLVLDAWDIGSWCWVYPDALAGLPTLQPLMARASECMQARILHQHSVGDLATMGHFLISAGNTTDAVPYLAYATSEALSLLAPLVLETPEDEGLYRVACSAVTNYGVALQLSRGREEEGQGWLLASALSFGCPAAILTAARALELDGNIPTARQLYALYVSAVDANPLIAIHEATVSNPVPANAEELQAEWQRVLGAVRAMAAPDFAFARVLDGAATPVSNNEVGSMAYHSIYSGENDKELRSLLPHVYRKAVSGLDYTAPHAAAILSSPSAVAAWGASLGTRPLRVGFASALFIDHTQGSLMAGIMQSLAKDRFASYVMFVGKGPGSHIDTPGLKTFEFTGVTTLASVREAIAAMELDVMVFNDLTMDPFMYFLAFSRLAPVQVLTLNNGVTGGLPTIDFHVSSRLHQPPNGQDYYMEELLLLPGSHTYFDPLPPFPRISREELGLPAASWQQGGPVLIVCVQALMKLHVATDAAFVDIVLFRGAGGAKLVLISKFRDSRIRGVVRRLGRTAWERHGIPGDVFVREYVIVLRWLLRDQYLSLLSYADVVLDSYPFGGGATSLQALAFGAPIVTLPAKIRSGRLTLAAYQTINFTELIATDLEDYTRIASRLVCNDTAREDVHKRLFAAVPPLYQDPGAVDGWEAVLVEAVTKRFHTLTAGVPGNVSEIVGNAGTAPEVPPHPHIVL